MKITPNTHLAYCTNIHPAETWEETWNALKTHTLTVRNKLAETSCFKLATSNFPSFAIGLRLSARAAEELINDGDSCRIDAFKQWLADENCYVFTINGFPYGAFHNTVVKEDVYRPDWTTEERLRYTLNLLVIIAELCPSDSGGSVSTLPGSFKEFDADEHLIFNNLYASAKLCQTLSREYEKDIHVGVEPEPLGHFENTEETLAFFERFENWATKRELDFTIVKQHIGINYDTCHFALEFDDCTSSLDAFRDAGLRISKIHLSNALEIDPADPAALAAVESFIEPTYLHQFLIKEANGNITRFRDLPQALEQLATSSYQLQTPAKGRLHFHIPLYADPAPPLGSTRQHAIDALNYLKQHPDTCPHIEMETYTWGVLPKEMQLPIEEQLTEEYAWCLRAFSVAGS